MVSKVAIIRWLLLTIMRVYVQRFNLTYVDSANSERILKGLKKIERLLAQILYYIANDAKKILEKMALSKASEASLG